MHRRRLGEDNPDGFSTHLPLRQTHPSLPPRPPSRLPPPGRPCHRWPQKALLRFGRVETWKFMAATIVGVVFFQSDERFCLLRRRDIEADLCKFVARKDCYSRVGRTWKRGYLLYEPPDNSKTSLIATIANFLNFDIYDLELIAVTSNTQLRQLLIATSSKSIIVIKDVDCTLGLSDRKQSFPKKDKFGGGDDGGGSGGQERMEEK